MSLCPPVVGRVPEFSRNKTVKRARRVASGLPRSYYTFIRPPFGIVALCLATGGVDCRGGEARPAPSDSRGFVTELIELGVPRRADARLSVARHETAGLPSGALPTPMHLALIRRIVGAERDRLPASADALHALALMNLAWSPVDGAGKTLDTSISYLHAAAEMAPTDPGVLSDIAAAELLVARDGGGEGDGRADPRALFRAIEAADSAMGMNGNFAPAAFNAALALERLTLISEAAGAWQRYREIDPGSRRSTEAGRRASSGLVPRRSQSPQLTRALVMDRLLGKWGAAVLAGDEVRGVAVLDSAAALGATLDDRSVSDETAALRRASGARRTALARAHVAYAAAQSAATNTRHAEAARQFAAVLANGSALPAPLELWATSGRAAALVYGGDTLERDRLLRQLLTRVNNQRYPAVLGRAHWTQGTVLLRAGLYERAIDHYQSAREAFERAREVENAGAMQYLTGESLLSLGDRAAGYAALVTALRTLQPGGPSVWLHNTLAVASRELESDGMIRVALRFSNEDVAVTQRLGEALGVQRTPGIYLAEALVDRARLIWRFQPDSVRAHLARADLLLSEAPDEFPRQWVTAQLRYVRGSMLVHDKPAEAVALLGDVITAFDGRNAAHTRNASRHVASLVVRARAHTVLLDTTRALDDLDSALALVDRQRDAIAREGNRAALDDVTRETVDSLVSLQLARGDTTGALGLTERRRSPGAGSGGIPRAPRGAVVVYRAIGDRLLAWTVTSRGVRLTERKGAYHVVRTMARARSALERRAGAEAVRTDLASLYDDLVAPVADRLAPNDRVTIVPDGLLAGVPFSALYDGRSGKYLIEQHELRVASRLADAFAAPRRSVGKPTKPLLVANPALDGKDSAAVAPLVHAEAEVVAIDSIYHLTGIVLGGPRATAVAFRAAMQRAGILHYSGHAIADERRPEQSYLLLAQSNASARLTAGQIREMHLSNLRLVVLAACETMGSGTARSTGFHGLASAFLAAGAHGVVGSLWRVDDASTRELMVALHRAYATSADGASALRAAQLRSVASPDPKLRSPAAWAAFQYIGN